MKKIKRLNEKQKCFLMGLLIISGLLNIFCLQQITLKNESHNKYMSMGEYLNLFYLNNHAKFNYVNGLFLMFVGIGITIWGLI